MRIAQPPNLRKRPSNNPKKKKIRRTSDEHPHKGGTRSDLAKATARGARRACTASASPTTGSPAYETRGNPPADQQSRIQHRITQITPPTPQIPAQNEPLTLFFFASRAAAAAADASTWPISPGRPVYLSPGRREQKP